MTEEKPDLAAGSLAYMPQGSKTGAASEGSETIKLKVNKSEESAGMAELADELESTKSDPEPEPAGAQKVAVKTTPVKKEAPSSAHVPPPRVHDAEDSHMDDHHAPSRPSSGGGRMGLTIGLVLFVLLSAVFGWLWWSSKLQVTELTVKVTDLESSNAALTKSLREAQGATGTDTVASPAPTASTTRSIPEVALRFKLTDTTKRMTYAYSERTDTDSSVHSEISFSTTSLVAAERKVVTSGAYKCTADSGPLGKLASYKATDTVPSSVGSGKFSALKVDNAKTFKLGETYYVFTASQAACSSDKTVSALQTSEKSVITDILGTLEVDK